MCENVDFRELFQIRVAKPSKLDLRGDPELLD